MGTLTIRNLDDSVKLELRKRAAARGVSMEQEVRDVLSKNVIEHPAGRKKATLEEIMKLSKKPDTPVDGKQVQDELWDYLYDDHSN